MTLFAYITENCADGARTHSLTDDIERLREQVEATQSLSVAAH